MSKTKSFRITDFTLDGRGVGRDDEGKVHFVKNGVVGDRVRVRVERERSSYSESVVVEVEEPSPWRREPPCQYFYRCGGCPLMHVLPQFQREWKRQKTVEELSRLFPRLPEPKVHASPELGYRTRAKLRLVKGKFGFISRNGRPFPVEFCPVLSPLLNSYLAVVEEVKWRAEEVSLSEGDDGVVLLLKGARGERLISQMKRVFPVLRGVFEGGKRLYGTDIIHIMVGGDTFAVSGLGFYQQNRFLRETLYALPSTLLSGGRVLDLYGGAGIHAYRFLERGAEEVFVVEANPRNLHLANENLRRRFPRRFRLVNMRAEEFEPRGEYDLVFLNPPRSGGSPQLLHRLSLHTKEILYLSCDIKTLVRDLAALKEWEPVHLSVIEQFPNTTRTEVLICLRKN